MFALPKYVHAFCGDCLIYQALDGFTRAYCHVYLAGFTSPSVLLLENIYILCSSICVNIC